MTLKEDILLAGRRMTILEALDGRSSDYVAGFLAGIALEDDYLYELLSPQIRRMSETIDRLAMSEPKDYQSQNTYEASPREA